MQAEQTNARVGPLSRIPTEVLAGLGIALIAGFVYLASAATFNAGRPDLFFLADAFIHGRTWLNLAFGPYDIIQIAGRIYVPFGPFPALVLVPLVAVLGPENAARAEPIVNAGLAAADVGLCWIILGKWGAKDLRDRFVLTVLFAFSTAVWWIVTRGGVWHTGHLIGMMMAFGAIWELAGRRRPWIVGLFIGAAFLSRAPILFVSPVVALWLVELPVAQRASLLKTARRWISFGLGLAPAGLFFLWYNVARFGSPLESGYALATLPPFLEAQRQVGLFSIRHLPMNLDYLFLHLPKVSSSFPFLEPDGLGLSVFITSPGLFFALRADPKRRDTLFLAGMAIAALIPNLLYYGGGWYQFGFRYALDAIPFVMALCGVAASRRHVTTPWLILIVFGVLVGTFGMWWASQ